jgi:outer membrane protein assembly factor BamB
VALNASNGSIAASISLVPNGQTGAPVWASPAVDVATNTIYVTTGNPGSQTVAQQPYSDSFVALDAKTLAVKSHWQIPPAQQVNDSDFGAAPTLFDVNGVGYIGALNKNGIYYVLKRSNLAAGPVWQRLLASLPLKQGSNVASSCYNNGVIYAGSTVNDTSTGGRVYALNAVTGQQLWVANTAGNVQSSLLCTNGLVVDGQSNNLEVRNASNGAILFHYTTGNRVQSTPVILNGVLYIGSRDGSIYAFTPV